MQCQAGGRGYFLLHRIQKTGCCKVLTSLKEPFKSVALKTAQRSNSKLLDFLGSLIQVSIRFSVPIGLHNLILPYKQNVTQLKSCGYIWRGLLKMPLHLPHVHEEIRKLWVKQGENLLGEILLGESIS